MNNMGIRISTNAEDFFERLISSHIRSFALDEYNSYLDMSEIINLFLDLPMDIITGQSILVKYVYTDAVI